MNNAYIVIGLGIALLCSILLHVVFFRYIHYFYRQLNAVQLDPFSVQRYPTTPIPKESGRQTVVLFGDSRAEQWPFPQDDGRFQFINRGIGGQTTAQALGRFDAHIVPLRPDIIVIQVGVNDLKNLALFPDQHATILANCKGAIRQIVRQADDSGALVILTTIFPIGDVPFMRRIFSHMFIAEPLLMQAIDEVNAFLRTLPAERVILLETHAILADPRGRVHNAYQEDLLHLNQAGYAALNQALRTILAAL